jgi:hypothetical protein
MKLPRLGATNGFKLVLAFVVTGACIASCNAGTSRSGSASPSRRAAPLSSPPPSGSAAAPGSSVPADCAIFDAAAAEPKNQFPALPSEPTAVTATWRGTSPTASCAVTHGDATFARTLLSDLEAAPSDFLGSRDCPADFGRRIALTFADSADSGVVVISPDGCPDIYLPGKNASVLSNNVIDDLERIAPPAFLPSLKSDLGN